MLTGRGLPASDPSVWSADTVAEFGSLTAHYMQASPNARLISRNKLLLFGSGQDIPLRKVV